MRMLALSILLVTGGTAVAAPLNTPRVLVFPIRAEAKASEQLAEQASALLVAEAARIKGFEVKALRDIQAVAQHEQAKQALGCTAVACASDLAASLNAEQLVSGSLLAVGKDHILMLSRIRTRDAVALARVSETLRNPEKELAQRLPKAVAQLFVDVVPPEISLDLRVLTRRHGQAAEQVLQGGEQLKQGDEVAFEFTISPQAHVYVLQRTKASGAINVLFPNPDIAQKNPLAANTRVRIPGDGLTFEVDNEDLGTEEVFVVASPRELPRLQEALSRMEGEEDPTAPTRVRAEEAMVALLQGDRGKCKSRTLDGAQQDGACNATSRGLKLKAKGKEALKHTARLRSAPGDDAVFHIFRFEHVAADGK